MTLTAPRVHVALAVSDLDRSVAFYTRMFGTQPVKERPGYAKFELTQPRLNFTLNESAGAKPPTGPAHYGIEVATPADVVAFSERVQGAGVQTRPEDNVTCCYAVMDKIWMHDPDGHAWEVFAITEADVDSPRPDASARANAEGPCCEPTCCT
jgi:catechol 2,3-dioxygenase-like lactoylglutathione lyase family enzyme